VGALGGGITGALVSVLLPTIARRGGVDPIGLAALTALPFIANLLSAYAGRVGPRTPLHLALFRVAGSAALLLPVLTPLPPGRRVRVPAGPLGRAAAGLFGARVDPGAPGATDAVAGGDRPGLLRRRADRGGPDVRPCPRRPAPPEPRRGRRHRDRDLGRHHRV